MTETIEVNGTSRASKIQRKNVTWVEHAYLGEVGEGSVMIEDSTGDITAPGFKDVVAEQTASADPHLFRGFAHRKGIGRGETFQVGASREYRLNTIDGNDLLRRRIIEGSRVGPDGIHRVRHGKRPKETISQRTQWLLENELSEVGVADYGAVASSSVKVDKDDLRGRYPIDCLQTMAKAVNWNYYVRWNGDEDGWELVFRNDDSSEDDTSTISISNVLGDWDNDTVFPPFQEAELSQDPEHVYSGTYATGAKGHVYEEDAGTAAEFVERDGITEDVGVRADSTLSRDARRFLNNSDSEEQMLPVKIRLDSTRVGLVQAGMRINCRMSHMEPEGWDTGSTGAWARIARMRKTQPKNDDNTYDLDMDLLLQESLGEDASACPYEITEAQTFYPLAVTTPEWSVYPWGVSDGFVYYLRPGIFWPTAPFPGHLGVFHFAELGAGGEGSTAYAGDCVSNQLQFMVIGPGTLTIQTEVYGSSRPMAGSWGEAPDAYANSLGVFTSGDVVEAEVTGECTNLIRLYDGPGSPCGGKWGFSQAVWVPA